MGNETLGVFRFLRLRETLPHSSNPTEFRQLACLTLLRRLTPNGWLPAILSNDPYMRSRNETFARLEAAQPEGCVSCCSLAHNKAAAFCRVRPVFCCARCAVPSALYTPAKAKHNAFLKNIFSASFAQSKAKEKRAHYAPALNMRPPVSVLTFRAFFA